MIEAVVGSSLAAAAGLNAWIPLLVVGLINRFTGLIDLPGGWSWLSADITLWIIGALLVVEVIADKVPALDTVNDVLHTVLRPAAGGLSFGAGASAEAVKLDTLEALEKFDWGPVITGAVIALIVHAIKATARPVANLATGGVAAPVLSTVEDITSVTVSILALIVPILAFLFMFAFIWWLIVLVRRRKRRKREAAAAAEASPPPPVV